MTRRLARRALVLGIPAAAIAAGTGWAFAASRPSVAWPEADPVQAGLDAKRLSALQASLDEHRTEAFLVARNGRLLHERITHGRWHFGADENLPLPTASMAKAVIATPILLLALAQGVVELDMPASRFIAAWRDDPARAGITIRDLATHSSGLVDSTMPGRSQDDLPDDHWMQTYWEEREERFLIARDRTPMDGEAGASIAYSNPGYSVLSLVLARAFAERGEGNLKAIYTRGIAERLDLPDDAWRMSYDETFAMGDVELFEIGGGAAFSPRALARIGELVRLHGEVDGQRILPAAVIGAALEPRDLPLGADIPRHPVPALGWWSNANGAWPAVPRDALVGAGAGHRVIIVIPSLGVVAVRFGEELGQARWNGDYWQALDSVLLTPLVRTVSV